MKSDEEWMQQALGLARRAEEEGEVPIGAVLVFNDECIGEGRNRPVAGSDPTAHAEILALRTAAAYLGNYRLPESTLYVTLEPCVMCAGALVHARVKRLVFGAADPRAGAAGSVFNIPSSDEMNHRVEVNGGVMEQDCSELLRTFFKEKR